jgi:hypothetical protein
MKEKEIKTRALAVLSSDGYVCWCPYKVRYLQTDIFGVFDIIGVKQSLPDDPLFSELIFIQLTTRPHLSERRNKIKAFFRLNNVCVQNSWVWAIDNDTKVFSKERII